MSASRPRRGPHPHSAAGHAATRLRRVAAALAALTCTLLSTAAITPAAWAVNVIPNDGPAQAPAGGVITAGVFLDRARAARRAASPTTT